MILISPLLSSCCPSSPCLIEILEVPPEGVASKTSIVGSIAGIKT